MHITHVENTHLLLTSLLASTPVISGPTAAPVIVEHHIIYSICVHYSVMQGKVWNGNEVNKDLKITF